MPQQPFVPPITISLAARPRGLSAQSICRGERFDAATLAILREIVAAQPDMTFVATEGLVELGGLDEASLDRAVDSFRNRCGTPFAIGAPQVGYVEAALKTVEKDYTYKRHDVGAGHMFARVKLLIAPASGGFEFVSNVVGGAVPEAFVPAVAEAIGEMARAGPRAGFPVVATRVTLVDGASHDEDSSAEAFARAAQAGFCEALVEGGGVLEPIMRLEVLAPPDYRGGVVGDIVSPPRRGRGPRDSRRPARHHGHRAARQPPRLYPRPARPDAGPWPPFHELRALRSVPQPREPPPAMAAALRPAVAPPSAGNPQRLDRSHFARRDRLQQEPLPGYGKVARSLIARVNR